MIDILKNLENVKQRILIACEKSDRNPSDVKLLLATKTVDPPRIKLALNADFTRMMGENKVQEVKSKYEDLKDTIHTTHFIGHLQTNKIKEILKYNVNCIESVDRLRLAEKLQHRLEYEHKEMDVFIQINTSGEESKFGAHPDEAIDLVKAVSEFKNIHIRGLMTIGLFSAEQERVGPCFKLLKSIQQKVIKLNIPGVEMAELSMGMSGDLETAIEEGATIVRVGTAIFGKRKYPDSYYWDENKSVI